MTKNKVKTRILPPCGLYFFVSCTGIPSCPSMAPDRCFKAHFRLCDLTMSGKLSEQTWLTLVWMQPNVAFRLRLVIRWGFHQRYRQPIWIGSNTSLFWGVPLPNSVFNQSYLRWKYHQIYLKFQNQNGKGLNAEHMWKFQCIGLVSHSVCLRLSLFTNFKITKKTEFQVSVSVIRCTELVKIEEMAYYRAIKTQ